MLISFNAMCRTSLLQRGANALPDLKMRGGARIHAQLDRDELSGKIGADRGSAELAPLRLSRGLDQRLGSARRFGHRARGGQNSGAFDPRQRAIVKIHYFGHAGGGAAALKAHVRYVARDAVARENPPDGETREPIAPSARGSEIQAHTEYLARHRKERALFYDANTDQADGAAKAAHWSRVDRRHFRIILSAENAGALGDLKPYARHVMAGAEIALGAKLDWLAIDHYDTDNAHTHIILRGRSRDGRALILPRDFVRHGLRNIARDEATDRLGSRTREDERRAFAQEIRAHRPTRLDAIIARQIGEDGFLAVAQLRGDGAQDLSSALKARARELKRLGLARETRRNIFQFESGWRNRLFAMELHLDLRRQIVRARTQDRSTITLPSRR